MVVADDSAVRKLLRFILQQNNYKIVELLTATMNKG
jgi:FixJ family two-component response regulator|tara:strand:- start:574 stop:681 length:108 start_codon:yes stop_codon:yes gene_type:complete